MHTSPSTSHRTSRWAATIVLLAVFGLLAACSGSDSEPEDTPTPSASTSSSDEPDSAQQDDAEDTSSDQSSDQSSGESSGSRPSITSFSTPENIDCHNGNFQQFSASWNTKNATKTTMSIDGGLYDTYGKSANISLPFNCSSPHTFKLTALDAAGHKASKSITLRPRNVQTDNDDDEGDDEDN